MRARTAIVVVSALATIGLAPSAASANGGAYIEFKGTHHLPGEVVVGEVYVSIPEKRLGLLDLGPFYAYLLPGNAFIEEGRPLPAGAIQVGTFAVEDSGKDFELTTSFTVPDLVGDYYQVGFCNDPCTLTGFGEQISGSVSIVATAREAKLLTSNGRLQSHLYAVKRDLRKSEKEGSAMSDSLAESDASSEALTTQVRTLEGDLAAAKAAAEEAAGRPMIDPWAAAAIAVALVAVAWALAWRRRRPARSTDRGAVPESA